ncbi:MAG: hypothetical protein NT105_23440 [Verrucomicrobia bacterium]|nr:hypothetical protein [Verrucomicrobiota bacterium]
MAHLWMAANEGQAGEWTVHPLAADGYEITNDGKPVVLASMAQRRTKPTVTLVRQTANDTWVLLVHPGAALRVNGQAVTLGVRILRDRDEIRVGGLRPATLFFSTERMASVKSFPGSDRPVHCPRCKTELAAGTPAVRCPNPQCGLWHHQAPDSNLPCWTYDTRCASCDQQTALDAGYRWTPEGL